MYGEVALRCPNFTVPATNAAFSQALVQGGRLIDTLLFFNNGLLFEALVPVAQCLCGIGVRVVKPVYDLGGLINCTSPDLCSVLPYPAQGGIGRFPVHVSALADLAVGTVELALQS